MHFPFVNKSKSAQSDKRNQNQIKSIKPNKLIREGVVKKKSFETFLHESACVWK